MVAELDKLEQIYSPHMVLADEDDHVRGSLRDEVDVLRPGEERGRNHGSSHAQTDVRGPEEEQGRSDGSLCAQADVPGPEEERGRTSGSLPAKADVPRPEEERGRNDSPLRTADGDGRVQGSLAVEANVPSLGQERGHTNGSPYPAVDWDNLARLSLTREKGITLSMPATTLLPVHACEPGPLLSTSWDETELKSRTYNPMGGRYTSPKSMFLKLGRNLHPFGAITGFRTNLGPISFPKGPVKGYILNEDHTWVLHATPPGVRRRGARGSRR